MHVFAFVNAMPAWTRERLLNLEETSRDPCCDREIGHLSLATIPSDVISFIYGQVNSRPDWSLQFKDRHFDDVTDLVNERRWYPAILDIHIGNGGYHLIFEVRTVHLNTTEHNHIYFFNRATRY